MTAAGVSAGIDMALALTAAIAGDRTANAIQLLMPTCCSSDRHWLSVWLFVLIPGLWGATIVVVSEWLLRSDHVTRFAPLVHRRCWRPSG